jgi:hypothetical protein
VFRVEVQAARPLRAGRLGPLHEHPGAAASLLVDTAFNETGATLSNVRLVTTTWANATGVAVARA